MVIHNFTRDYWGNALDSTGACWSIKGAVRTGDFIKINKTYYKVIEAEPCGDPKDMSFIKKYMTIGDEEPGEKITIDLLEQEYNKVKNKHDVYSFPL